MPPTAAEINTVEDLHQWVHEVLCQRENLLAEMFTTQATVLRQGGKDCGLQFTLQGPRCVKLGAVWAADQNVVYFYDTRGRRYLKEKLPNRLRAESSAA